MNPTILDLVVQIKESFQEKNLEEFHQRFKGDEEFKKIMKPIKISKSQLDTDDQAVLLNKLKKIISETKSAHKEYMLSSKKYQNAASEKEKVQSENAKLKNQIKVLEGLRTTQNQQLNDYQEKYNKVVEEEKEKKSKLVEGFQQEIKEISTKMEEVSTARHKGQLENDALKERMNEIKGHVEKRDKLFEEELNKLDQQRQERESKIAEQIQNIQKSLGTGDSIEDELKKIKDEEQLVEQHLNPYLAKAEEFQAIIEKTNLAFNLYKTETEKLGQQCRDNEQKSLACQRKCEKSDIYIVEQAKEHQQQQVLLKQKLEQLNSLLTLKQSLQNGLL